MQSLSLFYAALANGQRKTKKEVDTGGVGRRGERVAEKVKKEKGVHVCERERAGIEEGGTKRRPV